MKYAIFAAILVGVAEISSLKSETTTNLDAPRIFQDPQVYKDSNSGTIFYVESDGRHVSAIDSNGKLLWTRNPFEESKLKHYRLKWAVIVWIGKRKDTGKVGIAFNSSQFGTIDPATGDFTYQGQD